mgnify:FL=1
MRDSATLQNKVRFHTIHDYEREPYRFSHLLKEVIITFVNFQTGRKR